MTTTVHAFELAGLGRAPFRLVRIEERRGPILLGSSGGVEHWAGAPGQPMGTCAFCSTGIAECCVIRDADGREFIVGNVCVGKTGDAGLRKAVNAAVLSLRHARDDRKIAEGVNWFLSQAGADFGPSPSGRGTFAEYFFWMMDHAGRSGKLRAIREARRALGGSVKP